MTVKTEGQHAGEFIASEGNGTISREAGDLKVGENVIDGCVAALSAGKLVAATGASGEDVVGIFIGAHNASAAEKKNVPYLARLAEVVEDLVTPDTSSGATVDWDALNALNIYAR